MPQTLSQVLLLTSFTAGVLFTAGIPFITKGRSNSEILSCLLFGLFGLHNGWQYTERVAYPKDGLLLAQKSSSSVLGQDDIREILKTQHFLKYTVCLSFQQACQHQNNSPALSTSIFNIFHLCTGQLFNKSKGNRTEGVEGTFSEQTQLT